MTPAVYRNGRYESIMARQQTQIVALWDTLEALRLALIALHSTLDPETHIPPLPVISNRAFGMGR